MAPHHVELRAVEVRARLLRVDARLVQNLGAVNVPDAREHRLIHEGETDGFASGAELVPQRVGIRVFAGGSWPSFERLRWYPDSSIRSTVMALSRATMPSSRCSSRNRVVAVGSGHESASWVLNRPDMPKCTCMTCASGPSRSLKK